MDPLLIDIWFSIWIFRGFVPPATWFVMASLESNDGDQRVGDNQLTLPGWFDGSDVDETQRRDRKTHPVHPVEDVVYGPGAHVLLAMSKSQFFQHILIPPCGPTAFSPSCDQCSSQQLLQLEGFDNPSVGDLVWHKVAA